MPIYQYICKFCKGRFERIEKVTKKSFRDEFQDWPCPNCGEMYVKKIASSFKVGSGLLETTGKSGYLTDDLTLGKLIDEGGIPSEEKRRLKERSDMIERQNKYTKELNARAKKYHFDPVGD